MSRPRNILLRGVVPAVGAAIALIVAVMLMLNAGHQTTGAGVPVAHAQSCATGFSVTPASGPVGSVVTLSGSGWPAGHVVGIYFVDSGRHLRPVNLSRFGVPASGSWSTTVTIPATSVFHAVGDETTSSSAATQTISQPVGAGSYLLYAAASNSVAYSISAICPVKFTVTSASAAVSGAASGSLPFGGLAGLLSLLALLTLAGSAFALRRRGPKQVLKRVVPLGLAVLAIVGVSNLLAFAPTPGAASVAHAAAAGTVLYSDDFESDTIGSVPAGWTIEAGTNWSVQLDGTQVLAQTSTSNSTLYGIAAGNPTWTDYSVAANVKPGPGSTTLNTSVVALDGRVQNANSFYSLLVKNGNLWYLGKKVNGTWSTLAYGGTSYNTTSWYSWVLTMTGTTISASINGTTLATVYDSTFSAGYISFKTRNQSEFDNIVVTATAASPTATATSTPAATATATATPGGSATPTPTVAATPTATTTDGGSATPTATGSATATPTATATATPLPTATPTPAGFGTITGQVTDSSGVPIAGAQISTMPASATATTDGAGDYTLAAVPATTYSVIAAASGYNASYVSGVNVPASGTAQVTTMALAAVPAYTSMDTYYRPNQPGWNPASDGHTWLDDTSTYPGSSASISGNQGYVDTYTAATDRDEWMGQTYSDQMVSADFQVQQYGQDAYQHGARLLGRITGSNTYIDYAINYATSTLQIWVNNNGNWYMMSQVSVAPFQTGTWYHARLLTVGTMSYGKVWAYGTAEPGWMISGSQGSLKSGMGGLRSTYCDINWANFTTQAVTTITGKVTDASGNAIAGATVTDGTQTVTTDSNGRYVLIESNTAASYTVTASASGHTTQSQTATTTSLTSTTVNFALN
jgi:hypothetical protein